MTMPQPDATGRLAEVRDAIAAAARAGGRDSTDVRLIAVSKTFPVDAIAPVLDAGQVDFGENRVQEAAGKWPDLRRADTRLHLIGPLQSNKAADAIALFDVIHSVDRMKIARALAAEMDRQGRRPELFVQVNVGEEPQKSGVDPLDAEDFVRACREDLGLEIAGLMCLPPASEDPAPHFALLADMAARLNLSRLSMGMSADYETAIRFGATDVRVGSAIFGARHATQMRESGVR